MCYGNGLEDAADTENDYQCFADKLLQLEMRYE